MTIMIKDDRITSPDTPHVAIRKSLTSWHVTWLKIEHGPLTRNQAITAMTLAAIVGATGHVTKADPIWPHIRDWAAELGLNPQNAITYVTDPPQWEE